MERITDIADSPYVSLCKIYIEHVSCKKWHARSLLKPAISTQSQFVPPVGPKMPCLHRRRNRGGQGGPGPPPLFGELIYAYTAKSHDAETIRDVMYSAQSVPRAGACARVIS